MAKKYPTIFNNKERIVRHVYSPQNINPNTKVLKANFLQFRYNPETKENELSCNRFEFDSLDNCRLFGKKNARPPKAEYYGFACTNVFHIESQDGYSLMFTPKLEESPPNYFHCDVYDKGNPQIIKGEASSAKMNYERETFLKKWYPYWDDEQLIFKEVIQPPV